MTASSTHRPRIVLAYSGGPTTSAAIRWLAETQGADVVALTLDLGAGGELQEIHERALTMGAVRAHVIDTREEFADHYLLPALQAGALRPGGDTPDTLARPLIAKKVVEIARIERTAIVAHGAPSGSGLETLVRATDPSLTILAAPPDAAEFARLHNVIVPPAVPRRATVAKPDHGADVAIAFDRHVPLAINDVPMSLTELIESLSVIAVQHGVTGTSGFAGAPAIAVLQAAFDARLREESTTIVRVKLQHGTITAAATASTPVAADTLPAARPS